MQLFNEVSDLVTVVISVVAFVFSILTYYRSEIVEKKKNTVSAYIELQETLHCLYEYQKDEIEDFVNDKHSSEYKCLSSCVARLEIFAAGVKNQLYDFDLLYEMSNGFLDGDIRRKVQQIMDKKTKNCCAPPRRRQDLRDGERGPGYTHSPRGREGEYRQWLC